MSDNIRYADDPIYVRLVKERQQAEGERDELRAEVERLRGAVTDLGVAYIAAQSKACPRCGYDRTQEP